MPVAAAAPIRPDSSPSVYRRGACHQHRVSAKPAGCLSRSPPQSHAHLQIRRNPPRRAPPVEGTLSAPSPHFAAAEAQGSVPRHSRAHIPVRGLPRGGTRAPSCRVRRRAHENRAGPNMRIPIVQRTEHAPARVQPPFNVYARPCRQRHHFRKSPCRPEGAACAPVRSAKRGSDARGDADMSKDAGLGRCAMGK